MKSYPTLQKAFVLWLSGGRLAQLQALPDVQQLIGRGVTIELESSPIIEPLAQQYQVVCGQSPACFGFFDSLVPACHHPDPHRIIDGYTVIEQQSGRGTPPPSLPQLLREAGWHIEYEEVSLAQLGDTAHRRTALPITTSTCYIIKCPLAQSAEATDLQSHLPTVLQAARAWTGEHGLLALFSETRPATVKAFINLNNFLADMGVIERDMQDHIHWSDTVAYYAGHGQLWVNQLGREPRGIVHPRDEYEEVCEALVKALPEKVRDPVTGLPVIERIYRKTEIYTGNYLFSAPDLVVLFKPGYAPSPRSTYGTLDSTTWSVPAPGTVVFAGVHPSMTRGFFLGASPALRANVSLDGPLTAVASTLLHALGVTYTQTHGAPMSAAFAPSYLETYPIVTDIQQDGLSEEDEELVINRLRDLGYI
jgi:hypothetical protein